LWDDTDADDDLYFTTKMTKITEIRMKNVTTFSNDNDNNDDD